MLYPTELRAQPISGTFLARFRVKGKLIWRSLKTDKITVARLRLVDMQGGPYNFLVPHDTKAAAYFRVRGPHAGRP